MDGPILEIEKLKKRFRSHWTFSPVEAVSELSMDLQEGESFGFIGHNGAGKTTTIKCILGLIRKTEGSIRFRGKELCRASQRAELGYLPELPYFYDHLTVSETLSLFGQLNGLSGQILQRRIDSISALVGLEEKLRSSVHALSKGLKQRLGLAQAIIHDPQFLLLDEPFSGLDPLGRMEFRKIILDLRKQGRTIFMSSHILSDVEDICDRVGIMARGRLKKVFALSESAQLFGEVYELRLRSTASRLERSEMGLVAEHIEAAPQGETLVLQYNSYDTAKQALERAIAAGSQIISFQPRSSSLEEIFVQITQASSAGQ